MHTTLSYLILLQSSPHAGLIWPSPRWSGPDHHAQGKSPSPAAETRGAHPSGLGPQPPCSEEFALAGQGQAAPPDNMSRSGPVLPHAILPPLSILSPSFGCLPALSASSSCPTGVRSLPYHFLLIEWRQKKGHRGWAMASSNGQKRVSLLAASSRTQSSGWRGSSLGWSSAEGGRERFVRGQLASPT
jgi:hypothetical protein